MNMANVIQSFDDGFACIKCGPEYYMYLLKSVVVLIISFKVWWYWINTVHQVHKNLTDVCITVKASVDNTEWASSTCHSNLSDRKLPVCFKANKMNFPVKPECLDFTPLEERLKSLGVPFMQIILCELPRGGQLSIHGNVVNVPADVNSVVNTL